MEENNMGIVGNVSDYIKKMSPWQFITGIVLVNAAVLTGLAAPKVLVGREGVNDQRRYLNWATDNEPIRAQVRLDEKGYIDTLRTYNGTHGELVFVETSDWNKDGNPDGVGVAITTGERIRGNRKTLFKDSFSRDANVLFPGDFSGKLTLEQAYNVSPEIQRFVVNGNLDPEALARATSREAYQMTGADTDPRFQVKRK